MQISSDLQSLALTQYHQLPAENSSSSRTGRSWVSWKAGTDATLLLFPRVGEKVGTGTPSSAKQLTTSLVRWGYFSKLRETEFWCPLLQQQKPQRPMVKNITSVREQPLLLLS